MEWADTVVIGPGLGRSDASRELQLSASPTIPEPATAASHPAIRRAENGPAMTSRGLDEPPRQTQHVTPTETRAVLRQESAPDDPAMASEQSRAAPLVLPASAADAGPDSGAVSDFAGQKPTRRIRGAFVAQFD